MNYSQDLKPSPCLLGHFSPLLHLEVEALIGSIVVNSSLILYENYINASDYDYSWSIHASLLHDPDALPSHMHFYPATTTSYLTPSAGILPDTLDSLPSSCHIDKGKLTVTRLEIGPTLLGKSIQ